MNQPSQVSLSESGATDRVLELRGLKTYFFTEAGVVKAVNGVDLWVNRAEILGVVGESGCGKSMMARSILRLLPSPGRIVAGEVLLDGQDLMKLSDMQMQNLRGDAITMVFQEPMTSLDPVYTAGNQVEEVLLAHRPGMNRKERAERVVELLRMVGIPSPEQRVNEYPHQLSGGMRQRVMIAIALACGSPRLLIADEPTTALDVTIQAQILELFQRLQAEIRMSVMLITHDLGVVAETADRVAVMYAGRVVEYADVETLFENPCHPYTRGLLRALPQPGRDTRKGLLYTIPGVVPNLLELPRGCRFFHRCPYGDAGLCLGEEPELELIETDHSVRCRRVGDILQ
jgi:oligopeptide/dipeptide ABC transporter ATP-binding protein